MDNTPQQLTDLLITLGSLCVTAYQQDIDRETDELRETLTDIEQTARAAREMLDALILRGEQ